MATSRVEYFGLPPRIKAGVKLTKHINEINTKILGIFFFMIGHSIAKNKALKFKFICCANNLSFGLMSFND